MTVRCELPELHTRAAGYNATESPEVEKAVAFANANWNCLDVSCSEKVKQGAWQPVYGCAPFVSHVLAAGGFVPLSPSDPVDSFSNVDYNGVTYNLNCCDSKDSNPSCGGSPALGDYLKARGWVKASKVKAGTVAIVVGSDGPYSHVVFGVGDNTVDAHNSAQYQVSFSNYQGNLLLDPPPK